MREGKFLNKSFKVFLFLSLTLFIQNSVASGFTCPEHFVNGAYPSVSQEQNMKAYYLCNKKYAVLYSGISKTGILSAEHLEYGPYLAREGNFFEDARIPNSDRATLKDYSHSGYDRGHLTPSGDMHESQAMRETFSLANMIPQNPHFNEVIWKNVEETLREYVKSHGDVYVVTGVIFEGRTIKRINSRVLVPTSMYKAVYDPRKNAAMAWLSSNESDGYPILVSIAELERKMGVGSSVFPGKSGVGMLVLDGKKSYKKQRQY